MPMTRTTIGVIRDGMALIQEAAKRQEQRDHEMRRSLVLPLLRSRATPRSDRDPELRDGEPCGYVAFADEAIHHATPFFENRYLRPAEFKAYLQRVDGKKLEAITVANGNADDVESKTWPNQLPEEVPRRFLRTWV